MVGLVSLLQLIPAAILAPIGSVLGDRHRRERVLFFAYASLATMTALAALALLTEAPAPLVYVAGTSAGWMITLVRPTHASLLPRLARTPEELSSAYAASGLLESFSILLGPLLAGGLMGLAARSPLGSRCGGCHPRRDAAPRHRERRVHPSAHRARSRRWDLRRPSRRSRGRGGHPCGCARPPIAPPGRDDGARDGPARVRRRVDRDPGFRLRRHRRRGRRLPDRLDRGRRGHRSRIRGRPGGSMAVVALVPVGSDLERALGRRHRRSTLLGRSLPGDQRCGRRARRRQRAHDAAAPDPGQAALEGVRRPGIAVHGRRRDRVLPRIAPRGGARASVDPGDRRRAPCRRRPCWVVVPSSRSTSESGSLRRRWRSCARHDSSRRCRRRCSSVSRGTSSRCRCPKERS